MEYIIDIIVLIILSIITLPPMILAAKISDELDLDEKEREERKRNGNN